MNLSVVSMDAEQFHMFAGVDLFNQMQRTFRLHSCPIHPDIQVNEKIHHDGTLFCLLCDRLQRSLIVNQARESRRGEQLDQTDETGNGRSDRLISQQNVRRSFMSEHLSFGNRGAFRLTNPSIDHQLADRSHRVRLDMRTESIGTACHLNRCLDIGLDSIGINQQCRRIDSSDIINHIPIVCFFLCHQLSSKIASTSTEILSGSEPIPTALRVPTPLSGPQTLANSSLQPLIT